MWHKEQTTRISPYFAEIVGKMPQFFADFKGQCGVDYLFDCNESIAKSGESLLGEYYYHCNARGNALCARFIAQVLRKIQVIA